MGKETTKEKRYRLNDDDGSYATAGLKVGNTYPEDMILGGVKVSYHASILPAVWELVTESEPTNTEVLPTVLSKDAYDGLLWRIKDVIPYEEYGEEVTNVALSIIQAWATEHKIQLPINK